MKPVISTKIDDQNPVHTRIKVWNRGKLAGTLIINTDDAAEIIGRLEGASASIRKKVAESASVQMPAACAGAGME